MEMIRKIFFVMIALVVCMAAGAQSADKLYKDGKELYDAKKYKEAVPKLKAAAEKGHRKAQYRLGRCYDKGHGVTENDVQAFKWYSKSAAQEYAKAQYAVGKCYKDGKGVEKDRKKAVAWFSKAAKQDNADAQYALGKCYLKGKGVDADPKKAKSLLKKAVTNPKGGDDILAKIRKDAAAGDEDAKQILSLVK
jgi:hypothetical protein